MGVIVHLAKSTTHARLNHDGSIAGLEFKDGSGIDCDMIVVSAGIRPNAEIGRDAGLTVERAFVVDNHMRSVDDSRVYVVGECAQHRGKVYGLVSPLWDQAKVFADHVTETNIAAQYHGSKLAISGRFMQFYRENAKWKERTYDFVPRIGLDQIRAIVIDDRDGIAASLDANMQASVEAAYDPWKEATKPKTANQFANLIPVLA